MLMIRACVPSHTCANLLQAKRFLRYRDFFKDIIIFILRQSDKEGETEKEKRERERKPSTGLLLR